MKYLKALKKKYDEVIECVSYSLVIVAKDGKYGVVDRYSGKVLIPLTYDELKENNFRGYLVRNGQYYGVINDNNKLLIPIEYDFIEPGVWTGLLQKGDKYAFYKLNDHSAEITDLKYDIGECFNNESFSVISVANKYGFINNELKEIIPPQYDSVTAFKYIHSRGLGEEYLSIVSLNNQYGLIDNNHNRLIPIENDSLIFDHCTGLIIACLNGQYGIFDASVKIKEITPFKYHNITAFSDDMAGVCVKSSTLGIFWGFVDITGKEIIPPQFDKIIYPFIKDQAYVEKNNERFFIDKTGKRINNEVPAELAEKARTLYDNVNKLKQYLLHHSIEDKTNINLIYWQAPYHFVTLDDIPNNYSYEEEYAIYNQLRQKMRLEQCDDLDYLVNNELHYPVLTINFQVKINWPHYKGDINILFTIISEDSRLSLTQHLFLGGNKYIDLIKESKPFDLHRLNGEETYFFNALIEHIEKACHDLEIETERNKGVFNHQAVSHHIFEPEQDLNRFIELLNFDKSLSKRESNKWIKGYFELENNPDKFRKKLEKWLNYEKDELEGYDKEELLYFFLTELIDNYGDDWKFDYDELSRFISEKIGNTFKITDKDYKEGVSYINQKLETEFEYSLLDINSGGDDYNFIVVPLADKVELLEIAERLNLPIVHF